MGVSKNYKQPVFADSAYKSQEIEKVLQQRGFEPQIIERAYRHHPLTGEQKEKNKLKSKLGKSKKITQKKIKK
ncbi:MAG: hypothetical protein LBF88_13275, partial [Planctomycetaceae bacterium]|nr:hypothetical protein [Planctomycetaceae bacterium]